MTGERISQRGRGRASRLRLLHHPQLREDRDSLEVHTEGPEHLRTEKRGRRRCGLRGCQRDDLLPKAGRGSFRQAQPRHVTHPIEEPMVRSGVRHKSQDHARHKLRTAHRRDLSRQCRRQ